MSQIPPSSTPGRSRWRTAALFVVGAGLLANAAALLWPRAGGQYPTDFSFSQIAMAQPMPGTPNAGVAGARGLFAMPAQLGPNTYGLYLLDLDAGNIVVYRVNADKDRFHLMAARNFRNDRFLEDLNNDSPTPKEIQKLIQQQRQREALGGGDAPPETPPAVSPIPQPQP